jgi:TolA-binding protein
MKEFPKGENFQNASFLYGMILLNLGKKDDALSAFADFAKKFPDHPDAPRSIFEIGNIFFDNGNYKDAEANYSKVFETYPKSELAPNSLYKRLYSHFLSGDQASAEKDLAVMVKYYPESAFTVKGLFWQSDFYRDGGKNDKAEAVLQDILTKFSSVPSTAAEAVYECAYISYKTGKNDKAVKYLDELSEKYPNESIVSEGFMLRGDIYTEANEYEKAVPFYTKAAERRPGSNLETACWGRLGDCFFSIAWKTSDGTNIMSATEYFKKIVNKKNVPLNLKEQAIYKLAKCEEVIGDKGGALSRYREIIYGYQVDAEKGETRDPLWVVKSAQGASRLYLEKGTPEAAEAAVSIYRKLIELNIEPKDDFSKAIREIREKFKLKE